MLALNELDKKVELSFSEWLKVARSRAGVTQAQIASELGVKPQTISNWEKGVSTPSLDPDQTLKLCTLLNVTLEELARAYRGDRP